MIFSIIYESKKKKKETILDMVDLGTAQIARIKLGMLLDLQIYSRAHDDLAMWIPL